MLISARKLTGTPLLGTDGRRVGSIEEVVIDRQSGQLIYTLMAPSEERERTRRGLAYPLPWQLVVYDRERSAFRLDADAEQLKRGPSTEADAPVNWEDRVWAERLHEHYGLQPYWTVRSSS